MLSPVACAANETDGQKGEEARNSTTDELDIPPPRNDRRVRAYKFHQKAAWEDIGTGQMSIVQVAPAEGTSDYAFVIRSEIDGSVIFEDNISVYEVYEKQQDTLIIWTDHLSNIEYALSFQEAAGCSFMWNHIWSIQKECNYTNSSSSAGDIDGISSRDSVMDDSFQDFTGSVTLPPPTIGNLQKINEILTDVNMYERVGLLNVLKVGYIKELLDLFERADDLQDLQSLHFLFWIIRGLVMLNDGHIFHSLLSEDNLMAVIGTQEYDPEKTLRLPHRQFLTEMAKIKEVIPFNDKELTDRITRNYRIIYLKETIFPQPGGVMDEPACNTMNSAIYMNNLDILVAIRGNTRFLTTLSAKLCDKSLKRESYLELLKFMQEMCDMAKGMQDADRIDFFRTLSEYGLFAVFRDTLSAEDVEIRRIAEDMLGSTVLSDANLFRKYLLNDDHDNVLFRQIVRNCLEDTDLGLKLQAFEIVKALIDSTTMEGWDERDGFLNIFYQVCAPLIVAPLHCVEIHKGRSELRGRLKDVLDQASKVDSSLDGFKLDVVEEGNIKRKREEENEESLKKRKVEGEGDSKVILTASGMSQRFQREYPPIFEWEKLDDDLDSNDLRELESCLLQNIIELLLFCVQSHNYRIKYYIMGSSVITSVLKLLKWNDRPVQLSAVRFFRQLIQMKDLFYNKFVVKHHLLGPIFESFKRNGSRYNLLNSAILSIFEEIVESEVSADLVMHIGDRVCELADTVTYVSTFQRLAMKYHEISKQRGGMLTHTRYPALTGRVDLAPNVVDIDNMVVSVSGEERRRSGDHGPAFNDEDEYFYEVEEEKEKEKESSDKRKNISAPIGPLRSKFVQLQDDLNEWPMNSRSNRSKTLSSSSGGVKVLPPSPSLPQKKQVDAPKRLGFGRIQISKKLGTKTGLFGNDKNSVPGRPVTGTPIKPRGVISRIVSDALKQPKDSVETVPDHEHEDVGSSNTIQPDKKQLDMFADTVAQDLSPAAQSPNSPSDVSPQTHSSPVVSPTVPNINGKDGLDGKGGIPLSLQLVDEYEGE